MGVWEYGGMGVFDYQVKFLIFEGGFLIFLHRFPHFP
jgi:hypothetical protein